MTNESRPARQWIRPQLQASPAAFLRAAIWAFVVLLVSTTLADPDLWGHLRFGLDMLASGTLHTSDPYSFTADRPWINHEWLAELLMGLSYTWLGTLGLGILKLSVVAVVGVTLFSVAREEKALPFARDLFVAVAVFVSYSRTQVVRPQLFSVAILCVVLYLLRRVDRGKRAALWGVPVCFAVWANFHGGWIVGLAVLGTWMAGDLWRQWSLGRFVSYAMAGALSIAATLVNPYGVGLWQFLASTVRPERPDITDWLPLLSLPPAVLVIEAILPAIASMALLAKEASSSERAWRRVPLRDAAVIALLLAATFRIGRVDAFLQCAIAMLLAQPIVGLLNRIDLNLRPVFRRPSFAVAVLTIGLAAYAGVAAVRNLRVIRVEGPWIPDRVAAMLLRDARPNARVLTWFDWGEYALWQLSPAGIRVSMDGRRETVYSAGVTSDHRRFYAGQPDMIDYPDRIGADHVWLPSRLAVIEPLMRNGWTKVIDTGRSIVLARSGPPIAVPHQPHESERLFPWP
jgi:hypothetical protein